MGGRDSARKEESCIRRLYNSRALPAATRYRFLKRYRVAIRRAALQRCEQNCANHIFLLHFEKESYVRTFNEDSCWYSFGCFKLSRQLRFTLRGLSKVDQAQRLNMCRCSRQRHGKVLPWLACCVFSCGVDGLLQSKECSSP